MILNSELQQLLSRLEGSRCAVIFDIDETLLNPLPLYHVHANKAMGLSLTVQEIEEAGGLDGIFRNHPRYAEFRAIADRLRADKVFNSDVPLEDGALDGVNRLRRIEGLAIGAYLTTRPVCVTDVTDNDLRVKGFPPAPVLGRPEGVVRESTVDWKLSVLVALNKNYAGTVVMIDDSVALAKGIRQANHDLEKAVVTILYNGPLTYTAVARERIETCPNEHFFVAKWTEIPAICERYCERR
jgi:hypothetical protein